MWDTEHYFLILLHVLHRNGVRFKSQQCISVAYGKKIPQEYIADIHPLKKPQKPQHLNLPWQSLYIYR